MSTETLVIEESQQSKKPVVSSPMVSESINQFTFKVEELGQKLLQKSQDKPSGYWQIQSLSKLGEITQAPWYLAVSRNKIIFSGSDLLSWAAFLKVLKLYLPSLRSFEVQEQLRGIEKGLPKEQRESLIIMLNKIVAQGILQHRQINQAIRLRVFTDLESYSFEGFGKARFSPNSQLLALPFCTGLKLEDFILQTQQRRQEWQKLKPHILSLDDVPQLNSKAMEHQKISPKQKQQLEKLVSRNRSLEAVSRGFGKDPLEVSKFLVAFINKDLVTMLPAKTPSHQLKPAPELFIVDDAPVILQKFKIIVNLLGYSACCCSDPLKAVAMILDCKPSAIFVDINMPGASGFQVIKQIRMKPELAAIPIVILTGEESQSNKMRAKWARSEFLTKPPNIDDISRLLKIIAPLPGTKTVTK